MKAIRILAGVVLGYAVLVILTTLVQETWLGGVWLEWSSMTELILSGIGSLLAAVVAGAVGALLGGPVGRWVGIVMSLLVVLETTTLIATGRTGEPLWFNLLGGCTLIVGILLGAMLAIQFLARRRETSAVSDGADSIEGPA